MVRAVAVAAVAFILIPFALEGRPAPVPARYLVCEIDRDDNITIRSAEDVMLPELRQAEPRGDERNGVDVELFERGRSVYRTTVDADRFLRGEFAGPEGTIDGRWIEQERTAFVVRIPRMGDALELTPRATRRTTRVWIDELPRARPTSGFTMRSESAVPANRLDILVIGDGYTNSEAGKFATDFANLTNAFFNIPPYGTYKNFVNVTSHFVASPQSGADHPNCADGGPDPLEGTFVDTAFDATYCSSGLQRLLTVDATKVYAAAAAVPDWDKVMVIVNDPMYGGAGGGVSVVSTHTLAVDIAQHEFGHSFTRLADEYNSAYAYPACNDISGSPPCEPNVTNVTTRAAIKWNAWIDPTTPVPTTPQTSFTTVPGLFEGARYQTSGFYRPRYSCLMRSNSVPFCEVCAQSYILRLYDGWGGMPSSGIDPIEPGTETPAPGATSATAGVMKTFTATILEPVGGPAAQKRWFVDGVQQASTTNTLHWTPSTGGAHTVELRVKDVTTLVHPDMAGTSLSSTRTWTVDVALPAPAPLSATAGTGSVALSWPPVPGASAYEVARRPFTADEAPQFTSANNTTFTVGNAGAFIVMADGFPAAVITTSSSIPFGLIFADQGNGTGQLAGTPIEGTAGTYNLVFWATNLAGSAMQNFTLTVNDSLAWTSTHNAVSAVVPFRARIAAQGDGDFHTITTTNGTTALDSAVSPNTAYLYKVRAVGGAYSAQDLATVFSFTDEPLTAGLAVKAVHLAQVRAAIDLARSLAGLSAATYSHTPVTGGIVRAIDIAETRAAINAARTALGMTAVSFTNPSLSVARIRPVHLTELRNALR